MDLSSKLFTRSDSLSEPMPAELVGASRGVVIFVVILPFLLNYLFTIITLLCIFVNFQYKGGNYDRTKA